MDLTIRSESFLNEGHDWLGSARGLQSTQSIALAVGAFTANTHYPNGFLPSGTPLGLYTSGGNAGKYGPVNTGASDGSQNLAGFLAFSVNVLPANVPGATLPTVVAGALLDTGRVIVAKLPIAVTTTQQGTNPRFVYA